MKSGDKLERAVERSREDFNAVQGKPFTHFYCPILHEDQPAKLCEGHIVNQAIPNCSRAWVVQRKDIEGFYGSICEGKSTVVMATQPKNLEEALASDKIRKVIGYKVNVDGTAVSHYEVHKHKSNAHAGVHFRTANGKLFEVALKISGDEMPLSGRLQIEMDCNIVPEATASLLKAAHLTLFKLEGYQHVFSTSGLMIAEILRTFYRANHRRPRQQQEAAAIEYFQEHAGKIIPLGGFDAKTVKGSIEDRRFLASVGSSGKWFALGVLIRIDTRMNVVLLPIDDADTLGTYFDFVRDMNKKPFRYQFLEFVPDSAAEPRHWIGYQRENVFDPGPIKDSAA